MYVCVESLSLYMKLSKRNNRSRLTHTHFHNCLGMFNSHYISDYNKLVEDITIPYLTLVTSQYEAYLYFTIIYLLCFK
jgi:hypothetical protein